MLIITRICEFVNIVAMTTTYVYDKITLPHPHLRYDRGKNLLLAGDEK